MRDSDQGFPELSYSVPSSTSCDSAACATSLENGSRGAFEFAPFNLALQKQRFANMMDFLPELLQLFRVNAGEHLEAIRTALSRNELSLAATAAHTLKGMSSVVCATAVQELSGQLEDILKTGDRSGSLVIFHELETHLSRAIASLNSTPAP